MSEQKNKTQKSSKKSIIALVVIVVIGVCCFMAAKGPSPNAPEKLTGETVSVLIPAGASTEQIGNILQENGLIDNVFLFRVSSKLNGFDGTYMQGEYAVDTGLTKTQIMKLIQSGKAAPEHTLTVPEGYTVKQIAAACEKEGICTADEFIKECNTGSFDYDFLKDLPERQYRLEGYLFPDTYFLTKDMTVHDLIDRMLGRFDEMYTQENRDAVKASGHTLDEIVTIASMVEKEIKVPEERATAAGVIYNRLKENMALGIDATTLYAVGKTAGELTQADLQSDSPYNTRSRLGLPLGPIANPGKASFEAALRPEHHKYLYYVVEKKGADNHRYFETYDEFLDAKAEYNASGK